MQAAKHWADLIQHGLDDSQSLAQIHQHLVFMVELIQSDVIGECIQVAKGHVGQAEKMRIAKGFRFRDLNQGAIESIRDEERGETIAAHEIQRKLQSLIAKP